MSAERNIPSDILDLILAKIVYPALFVEAQFPSGTTYVWTGIHDKVLDGHTYKGIGSALSFETMSETTDTSAKNVTVSVSGLDTSFAAKLVSDAYQGKPAIVSLGFFDPVDGDIKVLPDPIWRGVLDTDEFTDSNSKCDLKVAVESRLMDILRKREWAYSDADQQSLHPETGVVDTGMDKIEQIQNISVPWGRTQK